MATAVLPAASVAPGDVDGGGDGPHEGTAGAAAAPPVKGFQGGTVYEFDRTAELPTLDALFPLGGGAPAVKHGRFLLACIGPKTTSPFPSEAALIARFPHADVCRDREEGRLPRESVKGGVEVYGGTEDEPQHGIVWMSLNLFDQQRADSTLQRALGQLLQDEYPAYAEWVVPRYVTCERHPEWWIAHMRLIHDAAATKDIRVVECESVSTSIERVATSALRPPTPLDASARAFQSLLVDVGAAFTPQSQGAAAFARAMKRGSDGAPLDGGDDDGRPTQADMADAFEARLAAMEVEAEAAKRARVDGGDVDGGGGEGADGAHPLFGIIDDICKLVLGADGEDARVAFEAQFGETLRQDVQDAIDKRIVLDDGKPLLGQVWVACPCGSRFVNENALSRVKMDLSPPDMEIRGITVVCNGDGSAGSEHETDTLRVFAKRILGPEDREFTNSAMPLRPLPPAERLTSSQWFDRFVTAVVTPELIAEARTWTQGGHRWHTIRFLLWTASRFGVIASAVFRKNKAVYESNAVADALLRQLWHTTPITGNPWIDFGQEHEDDVAADLLTAVHAGLLDDMLSATDRADVDEPRRDAAGDINGVRVASIPFGGKRPHVTISTAKLARLRKEMADGTRKPTRNPDTTFFDPRNKGIFIDPKVKVLGHSPDDVLILGDKWPYAGRNGGVPTLGMPDARYDDGESLASDATVDAGQIDVEHINCEYKCLNTWPDLDKATGMDEKHWCQVMGCLGGMRGYYRHMRRSLYVVRRRHAIRVYMVTYNEDLYALLRQEMISFWFTELLPRFTAQYNGLLAIGQIEPSNREIIDLTVDLSEGGDADEGEEAADAKEAADSGDGSAKETADAAEVETEPPAETPRCDTSFLVVIKPSFVGTSADIIKFITDKSKGEHVEEARRLCTLTRAEAEALYEEHRGKDFFDDLVDYMVGDRCILVRMRGRAETFRATLLQKVRDKFGRDVRHNAIHASDSAEAAARELALAHLADSDIAV